MPQKIALTYLSEFRGSYPDIPLPADIDREALGETAFFVTLPVAKVNAKSRNERTYVRSAVEAIMQQINANRPEGRWGHLAGDERATRYDPPAIRWLAAQMDAEGVVWAKGQPLTEAAREHFRTAMAHNARVGTSIYGTGEVDGDEVTAVTLETIDIADPTRAGIPDAVATPHLTLEMSGNDETAEDNDMGPEQLIRELQDQRQELKDQVSTHTQRIAELEQQVRELQPHEQTLATLREMAGSEDVVAEFRALREANTAMLAGYIESQVNEAVQIEAVRPFVMEMVEAKAPATKADVDATVKEITERPSVQALLKVQLSEQMGPKQTRPAGGRGEQTPTFFE